MNDPSKLSPGMKQYVQIKAEAPADAILLFRMGDFYEMFFDDAKKASPVLEVALTARAGAPMCGVPYHAVEAYIPKLLEAGFKVAIAEQLEDPALATKLVKRGITRIITPGAILDGPLLRPSSNNFLCALCPGKKDTVALAWLDISTGEFLAAEYKDKKTLSDQLAKLAPRECLVPVSTAQSWTTAPETRPDVPQNLLWTQLDDWVFSKDQSLKILNDHFGTLTLEGFGFSSDTPAVQAAGAILRYTVENLKNNAGHIRKLLWHHPENFLIIDRNSRRNLELVDPLSGSARDSTLLHVLDRTRTPMGGRLLRNWVLNPLLDLDTIVARQDVVELFKNDPLTLAELRETIAVVRDLERITAKLNVGSANPRDMVSLAAGLSMVPGVKTILDAYDLPLLMKLNERMDPLTALTENIEKTLADDPPALVSEGGVIRQGFCTELDELRSAATDGRNWVAELQVREQKRTGIKSLKVNYNRVFGFYIEVSKSNLEHVPEDYIRKQTMVNGERFITPELKEMESKILGSDDKARALEAKLFDALRTDAAKETALIQQTAAALAELDCLCSLADCAAQFSYCRPRVADDDLLHIEGGRHPVLDAAMREERFIPNDTLLDMNENRMMIITGPNMAGKSTYIRQTALLVIMAQIGSFIPADKAHIGLCDKIFTRVGATDDISRGQSTFMVEMLETANILNNATPRSLIILDEIGRGTSTFDGLSIAWAVAEYILDTKTCRARTQFATHYHELTELTLTRKGVKNYNIAVREYGDQIIFLRQIVPGAADKSYGIHVAKLAGLPEPVIKRAHEILDNLEQNALSEADQPSLTVGLIRDSRKIFRKKKADPLCCEVQPSLFDL